METTLKAADASEATISSASDFIDSIYVESSGRVPTPQVVRDSTVSAVNTAQPSRAFYPYLGYDLEDDPERPSKTSRSLGIVRKEDYTVSSPSTPEDIGRDVPASYRGYATFTDGRRQPLQARAGNINTPSRFSSKHYMSNIASVQQRTRRAKTPVKGDQAGSTPPRRHLARPPATPQVPDISTINVSCDPVAEYVVLISMYEVYNDRIFDLLAPPIKSTATKEYRRRPLLFKATESSPDRKVVAGLRKIICTSMTQALMVLEAGLHERRVSGTGSNSASSRSHGFFCIEVKKRKRSISKRHQYPWSGNSFTLVDLAGSERARDAKTAGATLAEAGKINESLMYLGQCLQMQGDAGSNSKVRAESSHLPTGTSLTNGQPGIVPFRQCKLTELLFSNSFPSPSSLSQSQSVRRNPQKAAMIVTADAHGDYNATSQILRYSALAKEVTVPRIPSITETILQANAAPSYVVSRSSCSSSNPTLSPTIERRPPVWPTGNISQSPSLQRAFSPASIVSSEGRITMEHAALEIARLSEESKSLRESLAREQEARMAAEAQLMSMEDRMLELEQAIREDCATEFEQRLAVEMARWKTGMQMAIERGEEHWDRKMEVFERSLALQTAIAEETVDGHGSGTIDTTKDATRDGTGDDKENVLVESLEEENVRLRRELAVLKWELSTRTPSKRLPLMQRDDFVTDSTGSPQSSRSRHASRTYQDGNLSGEILQRRMESLTLRSGDQSKSNLSTHSSASLENIRAGITHSKSSLENIWAPNKSRGDNNGSPLKKSRQLTAMRWAGGLDLEDPF